MNGPVRPWKTKISGEPCCPPVPKIQIRNLSLSYGTKKAFKDINIDITKSCVTGIIGPSGCGKSSFIHCMNRMTDLIPQAKISGQILLDDENIFDKSYNLIQLRKKVGIVFQEPTPLPLSIIDNITLALKEHKFDSVLDRAETALRNVGLWEEVKDKLSSPANQLSGGQKQRLCFARSLALEPEVILMDEPCSSLDPLSADKVEDLIVSLRGKYTLVIITHNLAQARRVCDHIFAFWYDPEEACGELIEHGHCQQMFENPRNSIIRDYIGGLRG